MNWMFAVEDFNEFKVINNDHPNVYYTIGKLSEDDQRESGRQQVANEIVKLLNEGKEPWWYEFTDRSDPFCLTLPHGSVVYSIKIERIDEFDDMIQKGQMIDKLDFEAL